jgi:hypothetical protein
MMKGLCIPFLSSTSRKMFRTSVVLLLTDCSQDRCGATHLLIRILVLRSTGCPDGRAACAVPSECHSGFTVRHGYSECTDPRIQTHCLTEHLVVLYVACFPPPLRAPVLVPRLRPVYSHAVSKRLKSLPVLGLFHQSDLPNIYGGGDLTDFLIQFVTNLDPNGALSPQWPRYTPSSPQLMTLLGSQFSNGNRTITQDTYRAQGIEFLTNLSLAL